VEDRVEVDDVAVVVVVVDDRVDVWRRLISLPLPKDFD
jgi:hypothetical protein